MALISSDFPQGAKSEVRSLFRWEWVNETKRTTHGRLINTHSQTLEWEHSNGFSLMPQIYTHSPTVALRTHTRMRKALSHVRTKAHAFCLFTQPQDARPVQSCINIWLHICQSADCWFTVTAWLSCCWQKCQLRTVAAWPNTQRCGSQCFLATKRSVITKCWKQGVVSGWSRFCWMYHFNRKKK